MEKYKEALNKSAELWNLLFKEFEGNDNNPDDIHSIEQHIHAIQNLILAKAGVKVLKDTGFKTNYQLKDAMGYFEQPN